MARSERMHRSGTNEEGKCRTQLANQCLPKNAYQNDVCMHDSTICQDNCSWKLKQPTIHRCQFNDNYTKCISINNSFQKNSVTSLLCNPTIRCNDENGRHVRLQSSVQERETFNVEHVNLVNKKHLSYAKRTLIFLKCNYKRISCITPQYLCLHNKISIKLSMHIFTTLGELKAVSWGSARAPSL